MRARLKGRKSLRNGTRTSVRPEFRFSTNEVSWNRSLASRLGTGGLAALTRKLPASPRLRVASGRSEAWLQHRSRRQDGMRKAVEQDIRRNSRISQTL